MPSVVLTTDDVIEAFCKMLEPGIKKNALPVAVNKYGVDILYKKDDASMIMFHFVTLEDFEIELALDMMELQRGGKEYLHHLYGLLCDQTVQARAVRQEDSTITIHTGSHKEKTKESAEPPKLKPTVAAHNEVMH